MRAPLARAWVILLAACATSGGPGTPSHGGAPVIFETAGAGATHYESEAPQGSALLGPYAEHIAQGIGAAAARGVRLAPDPRLAELARRIAEHEHETTTLPPGAAIELWAKHLGLFEPTPSVALIKHGDPAALTERIEADVLEASATHRYTHYGAYTFEHPQGAVAVLVLSWRWAVLRAVPREVSPGGQVELSGQLDADLSKPQLIIARPDGRSERGKPTAGRRFAFDVPLRAAGEHRIELLADSPLGPTVVANIPVYVGVPARTRIEAMGDERNTTGTPAEVATRVFELLNEERARAGVKPVQISPKLAAVALAHSEDMRDAGFVGHTSPSTGSASDRVQRAGMRVVLVRENIGRGYSAEGVHRGLMDSPGHRDNIVSPEVTHVGLGVVEVAETGGRAYLVTQLFTRIPERIDPEAAREELLVRLDKARAAGGIPAHRHDAAMSALCDKAAQRFFAEPALQERPLLEALSVQAGKTKLPYKRLSALMLLATSIEEASQVAALLDPDVKAIGIGVAQGSRPDSAEGAIAVVALLAY
jgi:uncharacterized protein YkwD